MVVSKLGSHIRRARVARQRTDPSFTLRKVAARCSVTPAYLSKIERDQVPPPGEQMLQKLSQELGEDPDVLMAMAGKISADLRSAILARPKLFADLIRAFKSMPDHALLRLVREVRDGDW